MSDPRPLFTRALDQAGRLIEGTAPSAFGLPTPCPEYDVRGLIGHLLTVAARVDGALAGRAPDIPAAGAEAATAGAETAGGGAEVARAWKERRAALDGTLAVDGVLDRTCELPWATLPGAEVIAAYAAEFTTHGWDLAAATGRTGGLDESLAVSCLPIMYRVLPAGPRDPSEGFGPVVPIGDDASPYERLVAWQGRDPGVTPGGTARHALRSPS